MHAHQRHCSSYNTYLIYVSVVIVDTTHIYIYLMYVFVVDYIYILEVRLISKIGFLLFEAVNFPNFFEISEIGGTPVNFIFAI